MNKLIFHFQKSFFLKNSLSFRIFSNFSSRKNPNNSNSTKSTNSLENPTSQKSPQLFSFDSSSENTLFSGYLGSDKNPPPPKFSKKSNLDSLSDKKHNKEDLKSSKTFLKHSDSTNQKSFKRNLFQSKEKFEKIDKFPEESDKNDMKSKKTFSKDQKSHEKQEKTNEPVKVPKFFLFAKEPETHSKPKVESFSEDIDYRDTEKIKFDTSRSRNSLERGMFFGKYEKKINFINQDEIIEEIQMLKTNNINTSENQELILEKLIFIESFTQALEFYNMLTGPKNEKIENLGFQASLCLDNLEQTLKIYERLSKENKLNLIYQNNLISFLEKLFEFQEIEKINMFFKNFNDLNLNLADFDLLVFNKFLKEQINGVKENVFNEKIEIFLQFLNLVLKDKKKKYFIPEKKSENSRSEIFPSSENLELVHFPKIFKGINTTNFQNSDNNRDLCYEFIKIMKEYYEFSDYTVKPEDLASWLENKHFSSYDDLKFILHILDQYNSKSIGKFLNKKFENYIEKNGNLPFNKETIENNYFELKKAVLDEDKNNYSENSFSAILFLAKLYKIDNIMLDSYNLRGKLAFPKMIFENMMSWIPDMKFIETNYSSVLKKIISTMENEKVSYSLDSNYNLLMVKCLIKDKKYTEAKTLLFENVLKEKIIEFEQKRIKYFYYLLSKQFFKIKKFPFQYDSKLRAIISNLPNEFLLDLFKNENEGTHIATHYNGKTEEEIANQFKELEQFLKFKDQGIDTPAKIIKAIESRDKSYDNQLHFKYYKMNENKINDVIKNNEEDDEFQELKSIVAENFANMIMENGGNEILEKLNENTNKKKNLKSKQNRFRQIENPSRDEVKDFIKKYIQKKNKKLELTNLIKKTETEPTQETAEPVKEDNVKIQETDKIPEEIKEDIEKKEEQTEENEELESEENALEENELNQLKIDILEKKIPFKQLITEELKRINPEEADELINEYEDTEILSENFMELPDEVKNELIKNNPILDTLIPGGFKQQETSLAGLFGKINVETILSNINQFKTIYLRAGQLARVNFEGYHYISSELITWGITNQEPMGIYLGEKIASIFNFSINSNLAKQIELFFIYGNKSRELADKIALSFENIGKVDRTRIYDHAGVYKYVGFNGSYFGSVRHMKTIPKLEEYAERADRAFPIRISKLHNYEPQWKVKDRQIVNEK